MSPRSVCLAELHWDCLFCMKQFFNLVKYHMLLFSEPKVQPSFSEKMGQNFDVTLNLSCSIVRFMRISLILPGDHALHLPLILQCIWKFLLLFLNSSIFLDCPNLDRYTMVNLTMVSGSKPTSHHGLCSWLCFGNHS